MTYTLLFISTEVKAIDQLDSESGFLAQFDHTVHSFTKHVGTKFKTISGLNEYLDALGLSSYKQKDQVTAGNPGLIKHFSDRIKKNPCYAALLKEFLVKINSQQEKIKNEYLSHNKKWFQRPALSDQAGAQPYESLEPGWIWRIAQEMSGEYPELSIALIGTCGHDDLGCGKIGNVPTSFLAGRLQWLRAQIDLKTKIIENNQKFAKEKVNLSMIERNKADLREMKFEQDMLNISLNSEAVTGYMRDIDDHSILFVPKAVDSALDLSSDFKSEISEIQAPRKGPSVLPAKTYHFLAGVYLGCEMSKAGMSPGAAAIVDGSAAWAYRAVRLASDNRFGPELAKKMEDSYQCYVEATKQNNLPALDQEVFLVKNVIDINEPWGTEISRRKKLATYDALRIFDALLIGKWSIGSFQIPDIIPKPGITLESCREALGYDLPVTKANPLPSLASILIRLQKPKYWSEERFNKALQKATTYLADFEWTKEQHRLGAKWGATHCREGVEWKDIEMQACSRIKSLFPISE